MTGEEWGRCADAQAMVAWLLDFSGGPGPHCPSRPSDRRLRLWIVGYLRNAVPDVRHYGDVQAAFDLAERFADGEATEGTLHEAWLDTEKGSVAEWALRPNIAQAARDMAGLRGDRQSADLLRDVMGDPFQPLSLPRDVRQCPDCDPDAPDKNCDDCGGSGQADFGPCPWLMPQVLSLARQAYRERPGQACWQPCPNCAREPGTRNCGVCGLSAGKGLRRIKCTGGLRGRFARPECPACNGTGRAEGGALDPLTLAAAADALEEAGLPDEDCPACQKVLGTASLLFYRDCKRCGGTGRVAHPLLAHLRSPGPHVRGCAAVDLVLGKE